MNGNETRAITVAMNQRRKREPIEALTSVFLALFENEITTCLPTKRPLLDWKEPKNGNGKWKQSKTPKNNTKDTTNGSQNEIAHIEQQ